MIFPPYVPELEIEVWWVMLPIRTNGKMPKSLIFLTKFSSKSSLGTYFFYSVFVKNWAMLIYIENFKGIWRLIWMVANYLKCSLKCKLLFRSRAHYQGALEICLDNILPHIIGLYIPADWLTKKHWNVQPFFIIYFSF